MNRIRRDNAALQSDRILHFCPIDNEQLIAYLKERRRRSGNIILTVVNLDPHHAQSGWVELDLEALGLDAGPALPGARSVERPALSVARRAATS